MKYLQQAGIKPSVIRLADIGIHGNSHVMMLEKNNKEVAAVIANWLDKTLPKGSNKKERVAECTFIAPNCTAIRTQFVRSIHPKTQIIQGKRSPLLHQKGGRG